MLVKKARLEFVKDFMTINQFFSRIFNKKGSLEVSNSVIWLGLERVY